MKSLHLEQTEEFHKTFNAPVLYLGATPSIERRKLRLKLIFEELSELAEAFGLDVYFHSLCYDHSKDMILGKDDGDTVFLGIRNTTEFNQVEALDACADLQVVLDGTILECGFGEIMDKASTEVFESNMSKACNSLEEAGATQGKYESEGVTTHNEKKGDKYLIFRSSDKKVLKNINYKPADLAKFIK